MEYEVHWGEGPLGVTLRPDLGEDMPPVVGRITRDKSAAAEARVQVGDMLVSINGVDTARQGYDHVVEMLKRIPRPAVLKFRVPRQLSARFPMSQPGPISSSGSFQDPVPNGMPERAKSSGRQSNVSTVSSTSSNSSMSGRRGEQYTVVWTEGPLGMILRPDDDDVHVPCIRKITGRGAGTGMQRATVGDVLVAVNGQETKSMGFRSTISLLKTIRKPAILKFKSMHRRPRHSRPGNGTVNGVGGLPEEVAPAPPSRSVGSYDIVWREGDLGLKLKAGPRDIPYLSKLTGKGTASGIKNACIGDELVSVNGVPVEGNAYHDTLRMLKHSPKPAVLRFRPTRERRSIPRPPSPGIGRSYSERPAPTQQFGVKHPRTEVGPNGEPKKRRSRIPLPLAKQLVSEARGMDPEYAMVEGVSIADIQDGTREAHVLRVEAKRLLTAKTKGNAEKSVKDPAAAKEAYLRAEQEAKVLAEALAKVKSQAEKYEKILEKQKKEKVLASVKKFMPQDVVGINENVLAELSGVITRKSYSDLDVVGLEFDEKEKYDAIAKQLRDLQDLQAVVPVTKKFCYKCGATERESKLTNDGEDRYVCEDCIAQVQPVEAVQAVQPAQGSQDDEKVQCAECGAMKAKSELKMDESDKMLYCKSCWAMWSEGADESPLGDASASTTVAVPAPAPTPVPVTAQVSPITIPPPAVQNPAAPSPSTMTPPPLQRAETVPSPFTRLSDKERADAEANAHTEAKEGLDMIRKLSRAKSSQSIESPAPVSRPDRMQRDQRGWEEFAQALEEMEEQARANGDLALANRLKSQRTRNWAELGLIPRERPGAMDSSRMNGSSNGVSSASSPDLRKVESREESAVPMDLKPTPSANISPPSTPSTTSPNSPPSSTISLTPPPPLSATSAVSVPPTPNEYDEDNTEDEEQDQMEMPDDDLDLRMMEKNNTELAKKLGQAQDILQLARGSILCPDDDDGDAGLSEEQIKLFEALTTKAEEVERESQYSQLYPDSDSSDSEEEEREHEHEDGEGENDGEGGGDDEEDDEGVWI